MKKEIQPGGLSDIFLPIFNIKHSLLIEGFLSSAPVQGMVLNYIKRTHSNKYVYVCQLNPIILRQLKKNRKSRDSRGMTQEVLIKKEMRYNSNQSDFCCKKGVVRPKLYRLSARVTTGIERSCMGLGRLHHDKKRVTRARAYFLESAVGTTMGVFQI